MNHKTLLHLILKLNSQRRCNAFEILVLTFNEVVVFYNFHQIVNQKIHNKNQ